MQMQIPSAPIATILINEQSELEYGYGDGQIIVPSNNVMEMQRYTCKIVVHGIIYVLLVCAVAFIIYEHHAIIGTYLGKIDDV